MKTIIVGYDTTDSATDALRMGAALASEIEARLIVAAVYEHPPGELGGATKSDSARYFANAFDAAKKDLPDVEFEQCAIGDGSARTSLADLAEDKNAELLVIGSTHLVGIGRLFAGTAGRHLFGHVPNGVVVAPRGWAERNEQRFRRIGVAFDGSEGSKLALQRAGELAQDLGAKLRLIAVAPYIDPHLSASGREPEEKWVELLTRGASSITGGLDVRRVLRQGRPATVLAEQSAELDLLVVGPRKGQRVKRALLGSVSSELVRTSACPVLVVSGDAHARDGEADRRGVAG